MTRCAGRCDRFVQGGDPIGAERHDLRAAEILFERTIYGDSADTGLTEAQQQQANLRGKVFRHFDGAGVVTTDLYDFKGNSLRGSRQFASDYKNAPDWSQSPALDSETFTSATAYDALNRAIAVTAPDGSVYRPTFNEAGLLEKVDVNLRGALRPATAVRHQHRLQRQGPAHARSNTAMAPRPLTTYDPQTFRLTDLRTTRAAGQNGIAAQIFNDPAIVQDLQLHL